MEPQITQITQMVEAIHEEWKNTRLEVMIHEGGGGAGGGLKGLEPQITQMVEAIHEEWEEHGVGRGWDGRDGRW